MNQIVGLEREEGGGVFSSRVHEQPLVVYIKCACEYVHTNMCFPTTVHQGILHVHRIDPSWSIPHPVVHSLHVSTHDKITCSPPSSALEDVILAWYLT